MLIRAETSRDKLLSHSAYSLTFMKLLAWDVLVDNGFSASAEFTTVESDIKKAVDLIRWPPGSHNFTIYPQSGRKRGEGNGVGPIKNEFVSHLHMRGWTPETRQRGTDSFDASYAFDTGVPPFAIEWETGNIASSHRAVNRMALGMMEDRISGGALVVASRSLYRYLTDRIGNAQELLPYHPLWRLWNDYPSFGYLAIVTVEHDDMSFDVPRIPKGTDGRSASLEEFVSRLPLRLCSRHALTGIAFELGFDNWRFMAQSTDDRFGIA